MKDFEIAGGVFYKVPVEDADILLSFTREAADVFGLRSRSQRARIIVEDLEWIISQDAGDMRDHMTRQHAAEHFVARNFSLISIAA